MTRTRTLASFALIAFAVATSAAAQTREETVERTISVRPDALLELKTFSGRVNIVAGGGNQVVIKAVRRATPERLRDIRLAITESSTRVVIDANRRLVEHRNQNVVETDFDIVVPRDMRVTVNTFSAPVTIDGVTGRLEVEGFSSPITLRGVSAPVRLKTFDADMDVQVDTWQDGDDMRIDSFSGDVRLRLPARMRAALTFDSFSGDLESDLPMLLRTRSRRYVRAVLNDGGSSNLRIETFSGSVRIQ